ncbi:MAG TPA: AMP-binding protein, partial [Pirellulales bacterium]
MVDAKSSETLVSMFHDRVVADGPKPALHVKRGQKIDTYTWNQIAADVRRTAAALEKLGVKPGDRVIQVSENRYEWIVLDLAILTAGAIDVAVHSTLTGPQIAYQIADSGAKLAFVTGSEQAKKLAAAAKDLPDGVQYVSFDASSDEIRGQSIGLLSDTVAGCTEDQGRQIEKQALAQLKPEDLATLLYTSGTTGEPKGVMLTHRNLV